MASIVPRKDKSGNVISYRIRVFRGYDEKGGKLKPYEMTYKPAAGMTEKQIQKELNRQAVQFEEQCKQGYKLGYPMHPDSITDWLDKWSAREGLPHINPHAFRHTLASVLCLNGIDITTISKWLGHKSVTTTLNIYEHVLEQGKEKIADCVSDVILKKKRA